MSGFATAGEAREETVVIAPPTVDDISALGRTMGLGLEPTTPPLARASAAAG